MGKTLIDTEEYPSKTKKLSYAESKSIVAQEINKVMPEIQLDQINHSQLK